MGTPQGSSHACFAPTIVLRPGSLLNAGPCANLFPAENAGERFTGGPWNIACGSSQCYGLWFCRTGALWTPSGMLAATLGQSGCHFEP